MTGFLAEVRIRDYRCLKDVACTLTPLHAFIGPNDSGKSSLLQAIGCLLDHHARALNPVRAYARFVDGSTFRLNWDHPRGALIKGTTRPQILEEDETLASPDMEGALAARVLNGQTRAQLVQLSVRELRRSSELIQHGEPLVLQGRGRNMAALYDALRDRSNKRFTEISKWVTELFPTVKELGLQAVRKNAKVLKVTLQDDTPVLSSAMSEGLLYYLAFAMLVELQRPDVYLIEEPENGLHPSRIAQIVRLLREIAEDKAKPVQVLMATHSPLVVNELHPEEVTVVTRDAIKGTILHPMKDTPHFAERSKVYSLGELWLSYADGKTEAPLFDREGR
jgi:predicted ATPase